MQLNQYAKTTGFTLRRKRTEVDDDGIVRRRTFECSHSGALVKQYLIK